jgi:hypothetical protein
MRKFRFTSTVSNIEDLIKAGKVDQKTAELLDSELHLNSALPEDDRALARKYNELELTSKNDDDLKGIVRAINHFRGAKRGSDDYIKLSQTREQLVGAIIKFDGSKEDKLRALIVRQVRSWFLKPIDVEATRAGQENEPLARRNLLPFFNKRAQDNNLEVHLLLISESGLVENRQCSYVATSVDGRALLLTEAGRVLPTIIEIKTVTTNELIQRAEGVANQYGAVFCCKATDKTFKNAVKDKKHRLQLLHHCATYDWNYGLYVTATKTHIISVVVVRFSIACIRAYRAALQEFACELLESWEDDWETNFPKLSSAECGHAGDVSTIRQYFELRKALGELVVERESPLPRLAYIKPAAIYYWNKWKVGVDTLSAMLRRLSTFSDHMSPHQVLATRDVNTIFLNGFHLDQLIKKYSWVMSADFNDYSQLKHHSSSRGESVKQWTYDLVKDLADNLSSLIPEGRESEDHQEHSTYRADRTEMFKTIRRDFDSAAKTALRLSENHTKSMNPPVLDADGTEKKQSRLKRCVLCSHYLKEGTTTSWLGSRSFISCNICKVPLCTRSNGDREACWDAWHQLPAGKLQPDHTQRVMSAGLKLREKRERGKEAEKVNNENEEPAHDLQALCNAAAALGNKKRPRASTGSIPNSKKQMVAKTGKPNRPRSLPVRGTH